MKRYCQLHNASPNEGEAVWQELMKFLWVCTQLHASSPASADVDEMWHVFILFTADYFNFCVTHAGRFLHHQPTETPHVGNRPDIKAIAEEAFGELNPKYWYHVLSTPPGTARMCDKNYCSEGCDSRNNASLRDMIPYMNQHLLLLLQNKAS